MEQRKTDEARQSMVPMPPGEHIVVSDPFIEEFMQSTSNRPHCAYGGAASAIPCNSYANNLFSPVSPIEPPPPHHSYSYYPYYPPYPSFGYPSTIVDGSAAAATAAAATAALGRVFPGDQAVIVQNSISPTHPYIPPVFPCGLCRREILDNVQAVQCYLGCKFWFHRTCVGLSEENFQSLLKDPYAEWMCDPCYERKGDAADNGQYKIFHSYTYPTS